MTDPKTLRLARKLYTQMTDNDPVVHCNRFPSWDELSSAAKSIWIKDAKNKLRSPEKDPLHDH